MADTVVNLFSPRALLKIREHGVDILNGRTPPDKDHCFTNNIDIFGYVLTHQYNSESILTYYEMSPTPQWLWFALSNRPEYFSAVIRDTDEKPVASSIYDQIKSLYRVFYSPNTRLSSLHECLKQMNVPECTDSVGCDESTRKMITFFYMTIRYVTEGEMSKSDLKDYVDKSKLHLKCKNRQTKNDNVITLAEEYVEKTQLESLLFQTILRLLSIFQKYLSISVNAYIFAPGVLHFFFNYYNNDCIVLEVTDRFIFLHQETTELVDFLKAASEAFRISDCSSHRWWDVSIQNSYHHSIYAPLGLKVILAPIRHDLSDFGLVTLENIEHALERSRLRGELQLGFVDKDYQVVELKTATIDQWEQITMWFMVPFMKIRGLPASCAKELWTQRHSVWIATATVLLFLGPWANISEIIEESILKLMPIEIKLFTGPVDEKRGMPMKTYEVLLPITIKDHQINISGVYGNCMIMSQNGHWRHLPKEVLFFFILCRKFWAVKIWLLNVNSTNNKEFVRSLHPLCSLSYRNPTEVKLTLLKKTITEDCILEHTAKLLRGAEREAWSIVRDLIPNVKPIFSDELATRSTEDD